MLAQCLDKHRVWSTQPREISYRYHNFHSCVLKSGSAGSNKHAQKPDTMLKLLLYSSYCLLQSALSALVPYCRSYDSFSKFIYQSTWHYLSDPARNRSTRLPPLRSIYGLHLNAALFGLEVDYLLQIQNEYNFIIWDPERINDIHFESESICFYINKFMHSMCSSSF